MKNKTDKIDEDVFIATYNSMRYMKDVVRALGISYPTIKKYAHIYGLKPKSRNVIDVRPYFDTPE